MRCLMKKNARNPYWENANRKRMWKKRRILHGNILIKDSKSLFKVNSQSNRLFGNERDIPESSG